VLATHILEVNTVDAATKVQKGHQPPLVSQLHGRKVTDGDIGVILEPSGDPIHHWNWEPVQRAALDNMSPCGFGRNHQILVVVSLPANTRVA
jgi:hypothetical protein